MSQGPRVSISSSALLHNLKYWSLHRSMPLFPVLKANAYGHGSALVATWIDVHTTLEEVPMICVARLSEALELKRKTSFSREILVLSFFAEDSSMWSQLNKDDGISLVLGDSSDVDVLLSMDTRIWDRVSSLHFNFNTGMNRLGVSESSWRDQRDFWQESLKRLHDRGYRMEGVMTHLACAEDESGSHNQNQVKSFALLADQLMEKLDRSGYPKPRWCHAENSAGSQRKIFSETLINAIRPGLGFYGVSPLQSDLPLRPVLTLSAPIRRAFWIEAGESVGYGMRWTASRRTLIGVIPLGYADGLRRDHSRDSTKTSSDVGFWIEGACVPIVGTVSMDMVMVDLTDHPRAKSKPDDFTKLRAEWIGKHQRVELLAEKQKTIPYEVLCSLGARLSRELEVGDV